MPLGRLATIVATTPGWIEMVVNMDEVDINPPGGPKFAPQPWKTRQELLQQFEASLQKGKEILQKTTDDRLLNTKWRMLSAGKLMMEQTRYEGIREGVLNHMAHHRGQLTVYLRLTGQTVPAIYGPSADEGNHSVFLPSIGFFHPPRGAPELSRKGFDARLQSSFGCRTTPPSACEHTSIGFPRGLGQ